MPVSKRRQTKSKAKRARPSGTQARREPLTRSFDVICLIAGPKLPEVLAEFGPHEIRRVSSEELSHFDQSVPELEMQIRNEPHAVSVFPGYSQLKTEWIMRLQVQAEDFSEAQEYAERRLLPRVLAVLDTLTTSWRPYRAKVVDVVDVTTGGRSHVFRFSAIPVRRREDLLPDDLQNLRRRLDVLGRSEIASHASVLMRQAVDLLDGGRDAFDDLAVLRMFTVIEGIVTNVVGEERSGLAEGIQEDLAELVDELEALLVTTVGDSRARVRAVRQTMGRIREKNLETISRQIQSAGESLGLSAEDIADAIALAAFRNSRLGHFSTADRTNELGSWAGHRAFELCKTFLGRYMDRHAVEA